MIWGLGIGGWGLVQSLSYLSSCQLSVSFLLHILDLLSNLFEFGFHADNRIGQLGIVGL